MANDGLVLAIKILTGCSQLVLQVSPSVAVYRIYKTKNVGLVSIVPLIFMMACSHVWMMYGYLTKRYFPVFSVFVVGDILSVTYLAIYWRFTTERAYANKMIAGVAVFMAIMTLYVFLGAFGVTGQTIAQVNVPLGFVCDICSICVYSAPMEKIFQVLRHKSAAFINIYMVLTGFVNNIFWLTYGLLTDNMFIWVPNILFFTSSSISLALYLIYNPKTHPILPVGAANVPTSDQVAVTIELPTVDGKGKATWNLPSPTYELVRSPLQPVCQSNNQTRSASASLASTRE